MSKKKITAPLSYDPGKGRPKEYLAYLNWQEMQALQRLNGGNMERGPRGLPSFPPDDAIGSNQTPGSGNWTGSPGGTSVGAGPGGDVGGTTESGNIGGAGTSTSTTSTAASSATSTTSAASQNTTDEAAQQAAAVNNAVEAAKNAALNEDARRAGIGSIEVGPMRQPVTIGGGQVFGSLSRVASDAYGMTAPSQQVSAGLSLSPTGTLVSNAPISPVSSASAAEEMTRRQFVSERLGGVYSDPVIKRELKNAIGQSMWDTRILDATRVAQGIKPKGAFGELGPTNQLPGFRTLAEQKSINPKNTRVKTPSSSYHTWGMAMDVLPERLPGETQPQYDRRVGEVNREIAKNITDPVVSWGGSWSNFVDPAHFQYGSGGARSSAQKYGAYVTDPGTRPDGMVAEADTAPAAQTSITRADTVLPQEVEQKYAGSVEPMFDPVSGAVISGIASLPSLISGFSIPSIPEASFADKMKIAAGRVGLSPEKFQEEVNKRVSEAVQNSGFSLSGAISSGISALNQYAPSATAVASKPYQERLMTVDGVTREVSPQQVAGLSSEDQRRLDDELQRQVYTPAGEDQIATVEEEYRDPFAKPATTENYLSPDKARPKFVSPETVQIMEDQERKNRTGIRLMEKTPVAGGIAGFVEKVQKLFTGKDIADYGTDLKREYLQADEDQKAAMRDKYPDIRRFAVSIGEIPPNTGNQFASSGTPTQELGGKNYEERPSPYASPYVPPYVRRPTSAVGDETDTQKQYRLWDMGIGIPEPGDPDYNDYMKYLKSRGTSAQV